MKNKQFPALSSVLVLLLLVPMISSAYAGSNLKTFALLDVNLGANSSTSVDSNSEAEIAEGEETNVNTSSESRTASGASLKLNSFGVAVVSSAQVNSGTDLEVFRDNIKIENAAVAKVNISSSDEANSEIVVVYKHPGRLFGFIPVNIRSITSVRSEADSEIIVESKPSWWSFLVAKKAYAKAELESQIRNSATVKGNVKTDASASAKARAVEAVIAEIQAHTSAQASLNS